MFARTKSSVTNLNKFMCCFSRPVISVSATNIFARAGEEGRQFLVYSMSIQAETDLAMILPLPVKQPAGEKDVMFIDLKGYADFFKDMDRPYIIMYFKTGTFETFGG